MNLYRKNLQLSQEMFTTVSCLEIALRNAIDWHYTTVPGPDWLSQATTQSRMYLKMANWKI